MAKKRIPANVDFKTVHWLDRQIELGLFASYSHAIRTALKLLKLHVKSVYKTQNPKSISLPKK